MATLAAQTIAGTERRGRSMTRSEVETIHLLASTSANVAAIASQVGRTEGSVRRALETRPTDWPVVWLAPTPPPPSASLGTRQARSALRTDLRTGRLTLEEVLVPVHPAATDVALADVVKWQWRSAGLRATAALEELGRHALRDRVNLMVAAGRASGYSRAWVAEHGSKWSRAVAS